MRVELASGGLSGEIIAPPSKSFAHRYLISAFLSGEECFIQNVGNSKDVLATLDALKALGAEYVISGKDVKIKRTSTSNNAREVYCRESGSTMRFLIPVASALGIKCDFTGEKRLMERPIGKLAECLNEHGTNILDHEVRGKLESGVYEIDASISSQYITGLMLALPILEGDSQIVLKGNTVSKGYLDITLEVLKDFGIEITKTKGGYYVKGGQKYQPKNAYVEGDFSGASFILSSACINGEITVKGLNVNTVQGDGAIVEVIKSFGGEVIKEKDKVTVRSQKLQGIEVDIEDIPDLAQIISVIASYAKGVTIIKNVERLKLKESDRLQAIIDMLKISGIKSEVKGNDLYIEGGNPIGGVFDGGNDHRTVMSSAILALHAKGNSKIFGAEVVDKSYPEFFSDVERLGGKINVGI